MKVKLLKKIRKRYSITHYPNGLYIYGDFCEGPQTILKDSENDYRWDRSILLKKDAYEKLYKILLSWIEEDYGPSKRKTKSIISEQLWYKK
jgi:hypothetical protein